MANEKNLRPFDTLPESKQRENGRESVPRGRRYCDGFERNAGANQPTDGLHINF